jgi:DNA-binding protein Fis
MTMKEKESSLKSVNSAEFPSFFGRGRNEERKRTTKYLNQMAVRLSHEKQIPLKGVIEELEKQIILRVLNEVDGSQKEAARILGMKHTTLNEKLKRYGIRIKRVSRILLCGLFLCCSFRALVPVHDGPVKKAKESAEIVKGQQDECLLNHAVLEEPERSKAGLIHSAELGRIVSCRMLSGHIRL